jgi:hypothetical protein
MNDCYGSPGSPPASRAFLLKNNEVPEGESDNPKGDPDDERSGEDTLETDGGGEALDLRVFVS